MSGPGNPTPLPLVMFDMSWLAHKAKQTMGRLAFEGNATGIVYGCLQQILTVCSNPRVRSNRVSLFFDGPKQFCVRRAVYPIYKNRPKPKTAEDAIAADLMFCQLKAMRKSIMPTIGFPCYRQVGFEADDLIAQAALQVGRLGQKAIIITADGDLWQCIADDVHWYDPSPGRDLYMDRERLFADHRVGPAEWAEVKAIAGCSSDNIEGVHSVGIKTATDFIWKLLPPKSKKLTAILSKEGQTAIQRNRKLVCLPHKKTQPFELNEPQYNPTEFFATAKRLGFESYVSGNRKSTWEAFFRGDLSVGDMQAARARRPN